MQQVFKGLFCLLQVSTIRRLPLAFPVEIYKLACQQSHYGASGHLALTALKLIENVLIVERHNWSRGILMKWKHLDSVWDKENRRVFVEGDTKKCLTRLILICLHPWAPCVSDKSDSHTSLGLMRRRVHVSELLIKIKTKHKHTHTHNLLKHPHTHFLSLNDLRWISSEIIASLVEL